MRKIPTEIDDFLEYKGSGSFRKKCCAKIVKAAKNFLRKLIKQKQKHTNYRLYKDYKRISPNQSAAVAPNL